MSRTSQLLELVEHLSERDQMILKLLDQHRLITASQIRRLLFVEGENEQSNARLTRLRLAKLEALSLISRLERRVGGVRAGSSGTVWQLASTGQRVQQLVCGEGDGGVRANYEPGVAFVKHTLACAEVYVRLREAERDGRMQVLAYLPEPGCWRTFGDPISAPRQLKPDAFVAVGVGEFDEHAFVEVDMATHGRAALRRKLSMYEAYRLSRDAERSGGVLPRVLWLTPSNSRTAVIGELVKELPAAGVAMHQAVEHAQLVDVLMRDDGRRRAS